MERSKGRDSGLWRGRVWALRSCWGIGSLAFALSPQLRHGMAAFGALVGTAVMLREILMDISAWWDSWAMGMTVVGEGLFVSLPITAAFACWLGVADARECTDWLGVTAARRPLPSVLMRVAPAVLWPVAGYLLVVAVALLILSGTESRSSNPFDALVSDIMLQSLTACLGYTFGRLAKLRLAAPLAGLLTTGAIDLVNASSDYPQSYSGPGVHGLDMIYYDTPPAWLPWLVSALFLALGVAVLLLCTRHRGPAALCALATVAVLIWTGVSHHQMSRGVLYRSAPDPVPLECTDATPRICTTEDTSPYVDTGPLQEVVDRLDGVPGAPTHYVVTAEGRNHPFVAAYGTPLLPADRRDHFWLTVAVPTQEIDDTTIISISSAIARMPTTTCAKREWHVVESWLTPPRLRMEEQSERAARLDALPEERRTAWLGDYLHGRECAQLPEPSTHAKAAL